jgi:hypothetical protein
MTCKKSLVPKYSGAKTQGIRPKEATGRIRAPMQCGDVELYNTTHTTVFEKERLCGVGKAVKRAFTSR